MNRMLKVYLAGGMQSGWQDEVMKRVKNPWTMFLDPRSHGLEHYEDYTNWDLAAVREADIIFAYMEDDNPSGIGMALEMGYAANIRRVSGTDLPIIILVMNPAHPKDEHLGMAKAVSNFWLPDLDAGIGILQDILDEITDGHAEYTIEEDEVGVKLTPNI